MKELKRFLWFIFKSPQRRLVGLNTLITDLKGLFSLAFGAPPAPGPLWVCVATKDRSRALLDHLVRSMAESPEAGSMALSVADCGSADIPELEQEIRRIWTGPLVFSSENLPFQRAAALNQAVEQAEGDLVFFCDADLSLPPDLVQQVRRYVRPDTAWFPVCQWQNEEGKAGWRWFSAGTGLCAFTKQQLRKTGMLNPEYKDWGKEDWDLFFRCYKKGMMPLRTRCRGLYHHWHPPTKPAGYVNMF